MELACILIILLGVNILHARFILNEFYDCTAKKNSS